MHRIYKLIFGYSFRLFLVGLFVTLFHLLASQSFAYQATIGAWTPIGLTDQSISSIAVNPGNPNILYVGTHTGVYKSIDGGDTWNAINNGLPSTTYFTIVINPQNTDVLYTGGWGNGIFKSIDGGSHWTDISNGTTAFSANYLDLAIDSNNPDTVYVGLYQGGGVWKTTNGGASWINIPPGSDVYGLTFDPVNSYIYAGTSTVAKSTDGGATWKGSEALAYLNDGGGVGAATIDPYDRNTLYAGTGGAGYPGLYKSTDGAATWTKLPNYPGGPFSPDHEVTTDPIRPNTIYAGVRDTPHVYMSMDAGSSWSELIGGLPNTQAGIPQVLMPANNNDILYAATAAGLYAYGFNNPQVAPMISPLPNKIILPGDTYTSSDSFSESGASSWTATVDYGDGSGVQPLTLTGMTFSLKHQYNISGIHTVTVSVTDDRGVTGTGTAAITVNNINPSLVTINAPSGSVLVNTYISASAGFTDPGILDTYTAVWDWGDGNTTTETATESSSTGSGYISSSHAYATTGVYSITFTVTDKDGGQGTSTFQYISVYDANTSFAGGRSFDNPSQASTSATGKVTFGISSKYSNNNALTGSFKMDFKAANISFDSTILQSLATSNGKAYLKGTGNMNGLSGYSFLVTAIDGSITGGQDLIRLQIKDNAGNIIYDTQPGDGDTTDPITQVTTGNIRIH